MRYDSKCGLQLVGPLKSFVHRAVHRLGASENSRSSCFIALQSATLCAVLLLLATFFGGTRVARAQEFRGTISGTVMDASGAVIPGASITVHEVSTGTTNHTVSDAAGEYVIPFLLPGEYSIRATANGFQAIERTGVPLQSQQHAVIDLHMQVGSATESVTVTGAPPQLDSANAAIGSVIDTQSVADLPLNGRTPTTLAELTPGVITTAAPQQIHPFDNNAGNSWSMGGTPNQVSEVLLDGSPDLTLLGALAYAPSEDTVAEVSVRPFDTDASFGHTIGGVVNLVTKSGTNEFHGTAYEFGQISGIDANTYFNNRSNKPTPVFHFNQYGLTFGGPVRIPKVYDGRNKLLFFFAFEGLKDSTPNTATLTVPTDSDPLLGTSSGGERAGDFYQTLAAGCPTGFANDPGSAAAMCNPSGKNTSPYPDPNQLYNPYQVTVNGSSYTRAPILKNQITSAGPLNSIAQAYMKLFPSPNNSPNAAADGQDNYIANAPSVDDYDNEFGRLDYNVSAADHVFFDMRHNFRSQIKNNYFGNGATGTILVRENWGTSLDNVYTLNSTTIFDTRLNWTYFNEVHSTPATAYSPNSLGFPGYMQSASELVQLPFINFQTGNSCGGHSSYQCLGDTGSALDPSTSYQVFTDMVKVISRHTLKVGFDGRQYRISIQNFGNSSGSFSFNSGFVESGTGAASQTFGGDLATFLLGLPAGGQFDLNARADYHQYYIGSFVQDDWRVTDNLTLNLGIRYDIDTPFREKLGRTVNGFNPTAAINYASTPAFSPVTVSADGGNYSINNINTLGGLTFPNGPNGAVYATNNGFFSPRIGFAWSVNNKTEVRGGFGIFVQPETLSNLNSQGQYSSAALSNQEGFSASTQYVASTNNGETPAGSLSNPFPSGFQQPQGSSQGANTFLGQAISFLAPVEHDPYSERWNIGVQRAITANDMVELMYVGNHALHLPVEIQDLNSPLLPFLTTNPYRDQSIASAYSQSVTNPFYQTLGATNTTGVNQSKTVPFSALISGFPQFGNSAVNEENQTIGESFFEDLIAHWEHRASHGLTLTANYSFSKLIEQDTYLNNEDTQLTRRVSPFDHTQHFTLGGTYQLPFGKGKMFDFGGSRLWDEILGGYVINGIYQYQSGSPIEFTADIPLQPGTTLRQISNQPRNASAVGSGNPALSTKAFVTGNSAACPSSGACDGSQFINGQYAFHLRTLPQTLSWVRQDGYNNLDASILKDFNFGHGAYFQLRFETFNTLNHAVFNAPNVNSATSSDFGYITNVAQNSLPRQVQIGGRIVF